MANIHSKPHIGFSCFFRLEKWLDLSLTFLHLLQLAGQLCWRMTSVWVYLVFPQTQVKHLRREYGSDTAFSLSSFRERTLSVCPIINNVCFDYLINVVSYPLKTISVPFLINKYFLRGYTSKLCKQLITKLSVYFHQYE